MIILRKNEVPTIYRLTLNSSEFEFIFNQITKIFDSQLYTANSVQSTDFSNNAAAFVKSFKNASDI